MVDVDASAEPDAPPEDIDGKRAFSESASTSDSDAELGDDDASSDEESDEAALVTTLKTELVQLLLAAANKSGVTSITTQPIFKNVAKKKDVCKSQYI
jgi:hypothetical protein